MTTLRPAAREAVAGLAAVFAGVVGAYTLTPVASGNADFHDWVDPQSGWIAYDQSAWLSLQATTVAVGAAVAAPVCVLLASHGSRRVAWGVVAAAALLVGIIGAVGADASPVYYCRALVAGVLIGAAVAGAWGKQIAATSLIFGLLGTWLVVWARDDYAAIEFATSFRGDAPLWVAAAGVLFAVAAAATAQSGFRVPRPVTAVARVAIVGAIAYVVLNRLGGAWILRSSDADSQARWAVVIAVAAVLVAVVAIIGQFAPATDGRFVLAVTAVTAAATPVATAEFDYTTDEFTLVVAVAAGLLATLLGLRVAGAAPHPLAGLGIVAIVTLAPVLWPELGEGNSWIVVRVALLAFGAGHAVGSNLPTESAFAAFGLVVPASSFAISTMYAANRAPLVRTGDSSSGAYETSLVIEWDVPRSPDVLMFVLVVCCAALVFLRSRRQAGG